jgi:outer membrane protein assembly factor BamB
MKAFRTLLALLFTAGVGASVYYYVSAIMPKSMPIAVASAAPTPPATVEPAKPEPAPAPKPDPSKPEAIKPEPKPEPVKPAPMPDVKPAPAKPEAKPEPKPEPTKPEPTKPEPVKAEPVKPAPAKAEAPKPVLANKPEEIAGVAAKANPADHTMFGGTPAHNFVNLGAKDIPAQLLGGEHGGAKIDANAKELWVADLGSRAYGGPIIAGGKVFVGTNNEKPRNKRDVKKSPDGEEEPLDKGVVMCFDATTGEFQWQAIHDKLPAGQVVDWPKEGICSTPHVEGNRVYYVSNRCTVVCADVNGMADGNQGITTEQYKDKTDVDIIWEYDMMAELKVFPHNMSACSPLVVGNTIFIVTANGVDENHINIPSPKAPSFLCLDKTTGKLKWQSDLPGKEIMHGQWSNPTYAEIGGVKQVIFPGGDGWLYAFDPESGTLLWKFDANPKDSLYELGGAGTRNDFIGTPVVYDGKVFIGVGQDPEHFTGIGHFWCIDPAGKKGDISPELVDKSMKLPDGRTQMTGKPNPASAVVWHYGGADKRKVAQRDFVFGRTMSTATIVDGLVYIAELQGQIHCLDAKTGKQFWQYDTKGAIWGSTLYVDGKVFLATESGELFVFKHTKTPKTLDEQTIDAKDDKELRTKTNELRKEVEKEFLVAKMEFEAPIRSTPVVANGIVYVMTEKSLHAFSKK